MQSLQYHSTACSDVHSYINLLIIMIIYWGCSPWAAHHLYMHVLPAQYVKFKFKCNYVTHSCNMRMHTWITWSTAAKVCKWNNYYPACTRWELSGNRYYSTNCYIFIAIYQLSLRTVYFYINYGSKIHTS